MPVIILEGADNTGKSTLAEALHAHFGPNAVVVKSPAKYFDWDDSMNEWTSEFVEASSVMSSNFYFILDRVPEISELIYGAIFRTPCTERFPHFLRSLQSHRVMFVLCTHDGFEEGELDKVGNLIAQPNHEKIVAAYTVMSYVLARSGVQVHLFNRDIKDSTRRLIERIEDM